LPPIWILGSSGASAHLAGDAGMGYSFASHFSQTPAAPAFASYRDSFRPTKHFPKPHAILGMAVCCAPTRERAEYLASTMKLAWLRIRRGQFLALPSPEEALAYPYTAADLAGIEGYAKLTVVGAPDEVAAEIERRAQECGADEVMITTNVHDHQERLQSYRLVAAALGRR
jgi:luciferase family oxidoreductase group 1